MWKLGNIQKKKSELWVNFGRWGENLQECFWLSKAYWMNEMKALFIEFRLGKFGGLEFGLEDQLGLELEFGGKLTKEWWLVKVYGGN